MAVAEREARYMSKKEAIYMSKFARGVAMAQALNSAKSRVRVGDWVTVREYSGSTSNEKRTVSGQVIYKNQHYFTLQGRHYREAFSFINMALGQAEIG